LYETPIPLSSVGHEVFGVKESKRQQQKATTKRRNDNENENKEVSDEKDILNGS
jgi:hypothetical protein